MNKAETPYRENNDCKFNGWTTNLRFAPDIGPYHEWVKDGDVWRARYKKEYLQFIK